MTRAKTSDECEAVDPYEGLRSRAHWKPTDAARVLGDWSASGESLAAFARRHGFGVHRLQWWRERVTSAQGGAKPIRLVPVIARPAPLLTLTTRAQSVVVEHAGIRVEVADPQATDPRWVAALLLELRKVRS